MDLKEKNIYKSDFKTELDKFADRLEKYVSTDNGDTWTVVSGNTTSATSGNGLGMWVSPNDKTKSFHITFFDAQNYYQV